MPSLLIIEDDPAVRRGLCDSFRTEDFTVETASDGEEGFYAALNGSYDCIILDLLLPCKSGMEICRDLRSQAVMIPVLMLTSKRDEIDKLSGFEIGADDYVTKPFSMRELHARVRALIRRSQTPPSATGKEQYVFGNITINVVRSEVTKGGNLLQLSAREFAVLLHLVRNENRIITRDDFLRKVWGYDAFPTTRTVDNYILALRKKIEDDPSNPRHILTVHTTGYKFQS
jgi:DNA-binding response OmpR family regulator